MPDLYDRLENRTPAARESALFRDLTHVLAVSKSRAPALRAQVKGLDVGHLRTRADLAQIPILRRDDLLVSQAEIAPFGGYAATRLAGLAHLFVGPDSFASLSGHAKDWWGMARALYAAGLRKGTLVLNTFAYDLVPFGHMAQSGAHAIGCPVIAAGNAEIDAVADAATRYAPRFFCGEADRLKRLLDRCAAVGSQSIGLTDALVSGPMKQGLRSELEMRRVNVRHAVILPEVGVVAYESGSSDGMTLVEGLLLEIVDPSTGAPVADGDEGEIVLSRINLDYPLLRYGTGLISAILPHPSNCGRTNVRIRTPREAARVSDALHLVEMRKRYPDLKMRLGVLRPSGTPHLEVEHGDDEPSLKDRLGETLYIVMRRRGTVEIVRPGTLGDDDGQAADEHPQG